MYFEESFFEDEVREGFLVNSKIKRLWAAELEVLDSISALCKRHNIPYFAEWGTLLGAIRHKGFIPWDDDIDIGVYRRDYAKLLTYIETELPDFLIRNYNTDPDYRRTTSHIYNAKTITTDPVHLAKYHGCPYMVGIDIFVIDNLPDDPEERAFQRELFRKAVRLYFGWDHPLGPFFQSDAEKMNLLHELEDFCGVSIENSPNPANTLYILADQIASMFQDEDTKEVTFYWKYSRMEHYRIPKTDPSTWLWLPFENTTVPVCGDYQYWAALHYGPDYLTPIQKNASHDYPCYRSQYYLLKEAYEEQGYSIPDIFKEDFDENT